MAVVKIDSTNPDNFRPKKLIAPGQYTFTVANDPVVEVAQSSGNSIVKVELRCNDDGEFKGSPVYDICAITEKAQFKLCHLALAAGTQSKEEIQNDGVDLGLLKNAVVECAITIEKGTVDPSTGQQYKDKNKVDKYLFEEE